MPKHFTLITLLLPFFFFTVNAQTAYPTEGPGFYFNNFQKHVNKNADSALYFARQLASNSSYLHMLDELLHNSFAQSFSKKRERKITDSSKLRSFRNTQVTARNLLSSMVADDNPDLKKAVQPIFYWLQVQDNEQDDKRLLELVEGFTNTQLSTKDLYTNRAGRYALLIYQVIAPKKSLQPAADQLLTSVTAKLKKNQITVDGYAAPRDVLQKKAWYRYMYAYANFIQGNALLSDNKIKEAEPYLKTAYDYSPDMVDYNYRSSFVYDAFFLWDKEKISFQGDYINYLTKYSEDKEQTLSAMLTTALMNPAFKDQLKSFYNSNFSGRESFNMYWLNGFNQYGKKMPGFSLKQINGPRFSNSNQKDKWILLDFWGTWCGPCRSEHPEIEKFYKNELTAAADKISFLTIACRDNEDKVISYMAQFQYTFPVAMADQRIENAYNIKSYPSKILISPQGKYIVIPFASDWVDFVKKYADL